MLGRWVVAIAGRDIHWAELDRENLAAAAGSVAVAAGPNEWTMKTTTVCWLSRARE